MIKEYDNKGIFQKGDRYFTKVRFNVAMHGHQRGTIKNIETDKTGIPLDREMRRRFKDTNRDGCITFMPQASNNLNEIASKKPSTKKNKANGKEA